MLAAHSRRLARAREQIRHLTARYHLHTDSGDALVEVVRGATAIARLLNDVNQSACHELVAFDSPPYFRDPRVGNMWPGNPPRHDLPFRVIFDPRSLEHPGRRTDLFGEAWAAEQQARVAAAPMKMALVDGRIGVMPLDQHTHPIETFLLVREPGLVAARPGTTVHPTGDSPQPGRGLAHRAGRDDRAFRRGTSRQGPRQRLRTHPQPSAGWSYSPSVALAFAVACTWLGPPSKSDRPLFLVEHDGVQTCGALASSEHGRMRLATDGPQGDVVIPLAAVVSMELVQTC